MKKPALCVAGFFVDFFQKKELVSEVVRVCIWRFPGSVGRAVCTGSVR